MVLGFTAAWWAYIKDTTIPGKFVAQFTLVHRFVFNKWYFDELYHLIFVKPAFWIGRLFWQRGDIGLIDRFGPDGAAWVVARGAVAAKQAIGRASCRESGCQYGLSSGVDGSLKK